MCIVLGFGTWIIERGMFMCIMLGRTKNFHVHCAWFGNMDYRTRYIHVYRACFGSWSKERGIFLR